MDKHVSSIDVVMKSSESENNSKHLPLYIWVALLGLCEVLARICCRISVLNQGRTLATNGRVYLQYKGFMGIVKLQICRWGDLVLISVSAFSCLGPHTSTLSCLPMSRNAAERMARWSVNWLQYVAMLRMPLSYPSWGKCTRDFWDSCLWLAHWPLLLDQNIRPDPVVTLATTLSSAEDRSIDHLTVRISVFTVCDD